MPCTRHPLYILTKVARLRRLKGALRENVLEAWKDRQIKVSDQNKIGKCTFQAEEFHWSPAMNACAHAWYWKLEMIWSQLRTRVMHSISSYYETWSLALQSEKIAQIFRNIFFQTVHEGEADSPAAPLFCHLSRPFHSSPFPYQLLN